MEREEIHTSLEGDHCNGRKIKLSKQEREVGLGEKNVTFKEIVWKSLWIRWYLNRDLEEEGE